MPDWEPEAQSQAKAEAKSALTEKPIRRKPRQGMTLMGHWQTLVIIDNMGVV